MGRFAPDYCYLALIVVYVAACFYFENGWPVVIGFAIGVASQLCLEWKRRAAPGSHQGKGE